jgi:hypothetical protein
MHQRTSVQETTAYLEKAPQKKADNPLHERY